MISDALATEYCQIIERALGQYRSSPDWDDICAEARLNMLQRLEQLPSDERQNAHGFVFRWARNAAMEFFRSPRNVQRKYSRASKPLPEFVSLFDEEEDRRLVTPDFAADLVDHLERERVWERVKSLVTAPQWEVLSARAHGVSFPELALSTGQTVNALERRNAYARHSLRARMVVEEPP